MAVIMNHNSEIPVNSVESQFLKIMQHADDFYKIELLRQAKSLYNEALKLNIHVEQVNNKIAECDRLLKYEGRVVKILLVICLCIFIVSLIV
jgi:hypothetical protein